MLLSQMHNAMSNFSGFASIDTTVGTFVIIVVVNGFSLWKFSFFFFGKPIKWILLLVVDLVTSFLFSSYV